MSQTDLSGPKPRPAPSLGAVGFQSRQEPGVQPVMAEVMTVAAE